MHFNQPSSNVTLMEYEVLNNLKLDCQTSPDAMMAWFEKSINDSPVGLGANLTRTCPWSTEWCLFHWRSRDFWQVPLVTLEGHHCPQCLKPLTPVVTLNWWTDRLVIVQLQCLQSFSKMPGCLAWLQGNVKVNVTSDDRTMPSSASYKTDDVNLKYVRCLDALATLNWPFSLLLFGAMTGFECVIFRSFICKSKNKSFAMSAWWWTWPQEHNDVSCFAPSSK